LRTSRFFIAAIASLLSVTPIAQQPRESTTVPSGAPNPRRDQYKRDVGLEVDGLGEIVQRMNDQVFSFAELGFQELETSKYLTGILRQNGFAIQENLAGIPTGWMASWGSGKPVIALGSDIDSSSGSSTRRYGRRQKRSRNQRPLSNVDECM